MPKSPDELKLDRLRSKREKLFRRVQLCYDAGEALKADQNNAQKLENFKIRYTNISETVLEYKNVVDEIIVLKQQIKPDENPSYSILEAFEDLSDHIEYVAANQRNDQTRIHMPKIELVKFDGSDVMLWPLFYENFKQLVHIRQDFSNAEKLQYLLGSISGKALKICSSVEAVPNNYPIIWNTLEKTYQDKKFLSSVYFDRILNCRNVPNHNPSSLQAFLEKFDPNVNALKTLNIPQLDDFMLFHIALSKLPQETINSSQNSNPISNNSNLKNKTFFVNNPNNNNSKNCIACNRTVHLLKDCSVFKNDSVEERFRKIKANHLCINCFSAKHTVSNCPSHFSCNICKLKHHTLLHRSNTSVNRTSPTVSAVHASTSHSSSDFNTGSPANLLMSQNNSQTVLLSTNNSSSDLNPGSLANVLMSQTNCQTVLLSTAVAGGFKLLKWVSNSQDLLAQIEDHLKLTKTIEFDKTNLKILGLQWSPRLDIFTFKLNFQFTPCTKRNLLSCVARIFDPLGFLSPLTLFIKLLIKTLWQQNFDWDQPAPIEIIKFWNKVQNELILLNELKIPRHLFIFENVTISLIGFSDASINAYAAAVYVRVVNQSSKVNINLLCSQSKVSPNSKISLPRLELCAATLLAQLLAHVRDTYQIRQPINEMFALSDSMITLHWIHSTTRKWKPFINNRVTKIKKFLPPSHWFFIPTKENVSDCASRGLTPLGLMNHSSWLPGPTWLKLPPSEWPIKCINSTQTLEETEDFSHEYVTLSVLKPAISPLYSLITYFSSWTKLLHATIYVLRFLKIVSSQNRTTKDLKRAELILIRAVQQRHFNNDYKSILENRQLPPYLRKLNPFIHEGVIRVGGRLANSTLSFDKRYPILLPKSDPFVTLLIDYNHKLYSHTGAHLLHSLLRQQYWILSARDIIRQRGWKCNYCFRLTPKPTYPIMANLPSERYLHTLQMRLKWNTSSNPIKAGTLVVVIQENIPPLQWPLAVIQTLHPGNDGIARVASIKTKNGAYIRPVAKLCPLPTQ
ncbi:hypothetical protein NQ317_007028 [Molorchus minor]|uniref:DUF5641 domain-containing protein n=1 Tax=Molorchus minor TaxID=1323400 RepID=A0ABQ9IZX3_9CUCU|nr:hypothetical protein NQ317_007028 [Molorchus minor]